MSSAAPWTPHEHTYVSDRYTQSYKRIPIKRVSGAEKMQRYLGNMAAMQFKWKATCCLTKVRVVKEEDILL